MQMRFLQISSVKELPDKPLLHGYGHPKMKTASFFGIERRQGRRMAKASRAPTAPLKSKKEGRKGGREEKQNRENND